MSSAELTVPDLVLLSLLSEEPRHGYAAWIELKRRQIEDWAGVSRAQIYYSLAKLERLKLIAAAPRQGIAAGPDRTVFRATRRGLHALAAALGREDWTTGRERPPFLTWMALSWRADRVAVERQVARRRVFVATELEREEATLEAVRTEVGHDHHEAVWMLQFVTVRLRAELAWLNQVGSQLPHRAAALHSPKATEKEAGRGRPRPTAI